MKTTLLKLICISALLGFASGAMACNASQTKSLTVAQTETTTDQAPTTTDANTQNTQGQANPQGQPNPAPQTNTDSGNGQTQNPSGNQ